MITASETERFWAKVDRTGGAENCWPWKGARHYRTGYGLFTTGTRLRGYTTWGTHRLAWVLAHGPIRQGLLVCHRCDTRPCCNEAHLFLGTHKDNAADMVAKGRAIQGRHRHDHPEEVYGSRNPQAKLTEDDVLAIRSLLPILPQRDLAIRYGVSRPTITYIAEGKTWRHIAH